MVWHKTYAWLVRLSISALLCPPAMADTKQIDANGTTFTYVEAGATHPVAVVLVHGAMGDYRTWSGEMDDFAANYHVIAYSLRYHYPNGWSQGDYSIPQHMADLVALLNALKLGPVHLVGHSFGGAIVARVARDNPQHVRSLVLAEPGLGSLIVSKDEAKPLLAELNKVAATARDFVQKGEPDHATITFMDYINARGGGFNALPREFQLGMLENVSTLKPFLANPPPPPFSCEDAGRLSMPTLLVEGDITNKDRVLINDELLRCIPNSSRVTVEKAAHPLEMVNPKGFNAAVLEFLAKH
jgi:pimeloyl-ACP methyl ester carboxylesterase